MEVKPTHKALDHDVTVLGRRCGMGTESDPCSPKGSKQPRPPVGQFLQFPLWRQLDGGAVVCRKSLHCRLQMEDKDWGGLVMQMLVMARMIATEWWGHNLS